MNNVVITGPTVEPITLAEAKAQLNLDPLYEDDDNMIISMITEARLWIEQRTGQSFVKQQRVQYMDKFPLCDRFTITNGPILLTGSGVTAPVIKYYDSQDVEQTWPEASYWLDTKRFEPAVVAKYSWPSVGDRPSAVSVTYFAGFGLDASTVPETIKRAEKLLVAHFYNNRNEEVEIAKGLFAKLEFGLERVLSFDTRFTYAGNY